MKILRTASLGSNFTGSYKKKECNGYKDEVKTTVKHLRWGFFRKSLPTSEANSKSCLTSKIELFTKIAKN